MATTAPAPYYDPYDFDIDADPYPVWKRMRDESPLYYNEKYGFYAFEPLRGRGALLRRLADLQLGEGLGPRDHQVGAPSSRRGCSSSRTRPTTTCTAG